MAQQSAIWKGSQDEMLELARAANRECLCATDRARCFHALMADQRSLDRLLFGRRIAERLRHEEHDRIVLRATSTKEGEVTA